MPKIVFWGTYDLGKPRVRLLLEGARRQGFDVLECHRHVWKGVEDKHVIWNAPARLFCYFCRWLSAYPVLVWHYLRLPSHDAVILPYIGTGDALVLWPWAWLRRVPVILDAYIPLYETLVTDRACVRETSLRARLIYWFEWLAYHSADIVLMDTEEHARYLKEFFDLGQKHVPVVWVGAETCFFPGPARAGENHRPAETRVLFYGQFIPLQGIETIIKAFAILEKSAENVRLTLAGTGQEEERVNELLLSLKLKNIQRIRWVPYDELPRHLADSDICLGIFGSNEKSLRVIPNKVYQIVAARRPLITADTPAVREWLKPGEWVRFVPPGDPESLANAIVDMMESPPRQGSFPLDIVVGPVEVGRQLRRAVDGLISSARQRTRH